MKKTAVTAPPKAVDGEDEKPAAADAVAEEATPTPMGRGNR